MVVDWQSKRVEIGNVGIWDSLVYLGAGEGAAEESFWSPRLCLGMATPVLKSLALATNGTLW